MSIALMGESNSNTVEKTIVDPIVQTMCEEGWVVELLRNTLFKFRRV